MTQRLSQQPELPARIYVEVRVFRWDPATAPAIDGPSAPARIGARLNGGGVTAPADGTLDRSVLAFAHLANAAAVYGDMEALLTEAHVRGLDEAVERVKAGRPPAGGRRAGGARAGGLHELEAPAAVAAVIEHGPNADSLHALLNANAATPETH
jgi:hypothetical protein